jgi:hypothetical protein
MLRTDADTTPARARPRRRTPRGSTLLLQVGVVCLLAVAGCGSASSGDGARGGGTRAAQASGPVLLHVAPGAARLQPSTPMPGKRTSLAKLTAARGESEGFQLQLRARTGAPVVRAHVTLDLPSQVYAERPLTVRRASPGGRRGTYYDPLLPLEDRPVRTSTRATSVLWVDVTCRCRATPRWASTGARSTSAWAAGRCTCRST